MASPAMPRFPQEIRPAIKGLLTDHGALFPAGGGIEGVPLDPL